MGMGNADGLLLHGSKRPEVSWLVRSMDVASRIDGGGCLG